MKRLYFRIFGLVCASIALLSACSEDILSTPPDTYSERCADNLKFEGFQVDFGGYEVGKSIPFMHSDGYNFSLTVTKRDKFFDDLCYKTLYTVLESAYPMYYMSLTSGSPVYTSASDPWAVAVTISFGQHKFIARDPEYYKNKKVPIVEQIDGKDTVYYGPDSTYFDKMEINGVTYTDVVVAYGKMLNSNKDIETGAKLYYQTKKGILKIEFADFSYIAINEKEDDE